MRLFSAIIGFRRHEALSCWLSKSSFLVFSFAENRDDDFLLQNLSYIERTYKGKSDNRFGLKTCDKHLYRLFLLLQPGCIRYCLSLH